MRHPRLIVLALAAPALLASCGDDLESRQAAVDENGPPQSDEMILIPGQQANQARALQGGEPIPIEDIEGNDDFPESLGDDRPIPQNDDEGSEDLVVDAAPDDLIDSAQGFSPEPMDDASGFDPTPHLDDDWGE